jgi:hypothetical protein
MKSAKFEFKGNGRTLYGTSTIKDDGTITVNLSNARMCSQMDRYRAKAHGKKIAEEGFVDVSCYDIQETVLNHDLIAILRNETQSLKEQYIQLTKEFATKKFELSTKLWGMNIIQMYDHFKIKYKMVPGGFRTKDGPTERPETERTPDNREQIRYMDNQMSEARKIHSMGYPAFEAKEIKFAEQHYEDSLKKLASKIESKGLNIPNLKVTSGHVGVNFNTILTDGVKTVRAWTIVASGEIQRPHYRYLVK